MSTNNSILEQNFDRRQLLKFGSAAGLGLVGATLLAGCGGSGGGSSSSGSNMNQSILNAAATAEALAVTMYYNIIVTAGGIFATGLNGNADDKVYLVAAYQEELAHYEFLLSNGAKPLTGTFYFPPNMFVDPQTTVNTLLTLEEAFIAAYLIGVRDFSTPALKVIAAQIMGVEAEHRALARVITNDLALTSATGLGGPENINPPTFTPNNVVYEQTFSATLPDISHVVTALGPFVSKGATGFSATPFSFNTAANTAPSAGQTTVNLIGTTPAG